MRVNKRCFSVGHGSIVRARGGHAVIGGVLRAAAEVEAQTDGLGSRTTEKRPPILPARRTTLKFASIKCQLCDTHCTDGGRPTNVSLTLEGQAHVTMETDATGQYNEFASLRN